jgi:hypothetical protein
VQKLLCFPDLNDFARIGVSPATTPHVSSTRIGKQHIWGSAVKLPATIAAAAEPSKGTQSPSPVDMQISLEVAGQEERIPETARRFANHLEATNTPAALAGIKEAKS